MKLPIHRILWAGNDSAHNDHLHVEGIPFKTGTPPVFNPGRTNAILAVMAAMDARYGTHYYFVETPPPEPNWSHMGWYNRRKIAGTNIWSQHAWANALDIGPLIGKTEQQEIYNYLTGDIVTGPNGEPNWDKVSDYAKKAWTEAFKAGLLSENSNPQDVIEAEQLMVFLSRAGVI